MPGELGEMAGESLAGSGMTREMPGESLAGFVATLKMSGESFAGPGAPRNLLGKAENILRASRRTECYPVCTYSK
jgi:hypothetical protein